ncbi:MAG: penicillin acylase family protein, partial [Desulfobacterales bacterium]|nr:penicillin acylase family protein [Desulfobacterales bacterium]
LPFPMLAHNRHRAWGLTMFENDDMDLYAETFNPDGQVQYKGQWTPVRTLEEQIKVKGEADQSLTIRITPHGPVVSDLIPDYQGSPVALSWVYLNTDNPILDVIFGMATANELAPFREAVSKLAAPGLNVSYADAQGNTAWWAAGRVPIRPGHVSGLAIHDGSSGRDDWLGLLPFEKNPQRVNPDNGLIVTANNQPTRKPIEPAGYLTGYFRSADRASRIHELLAQKEKWSMAELKKVQTDTRLWGGFDMGKRMVALLAPHGNDFTPAQARAFQALEDWDGFMGIDSVGATVFQFTYYHILKTTLESHLGTDQLKTYLNLPDHWDFLKRLLKTPGIPVVGKDGTGARDRETLVWDGFKNAVGEMESRLGDTWEWGQVHTVEYGHALGRKKPLDKLFNIGPFPCAAEFTAVNKMASKIGDHDYKVASLPSTRRLIDLKNPEDSWSIIPTGNAGNFMSPYYDNQTQIYLQGIYRKISFTPDQIQKNKEATLTLMPE